MTGTIKKTTINYHLRIPVFDAPGWGREMERNFNIIDAAMFAATQFGVLGTWTNGTEYHVNDRVVDEVTGILWRCLVEHTSAAEGTFEEDRTANPTYWTNITNIVQNMGVWENGILYKTNDFVYDGYKYGIVLHDYESGASFDDDVDNGDILVLIDLTAIMDQSTNAANAASASAVEAAASAVEASTFSTQASDHAHDAEASAVTATNAASTLTSLYSGFAGGTSGQVLAKLSNTDYDFAWIPLTGGGDMVQAIYDPQSIGSDAFARANHTGTQAQSTIAGLVQALADIWNAIATKVTNTLTLTAGDGLTGGGALDANRSFAVDATVVRNTRSVFSGTGLSGGGDLGTDRTLSVKYGTTAGTAVQGNDTRVVNAVQNTRSVVAGSGLVGGGSLAADRTISLGTPMGLDSSSSSQTTSTSHSHFVDFREGVAAIAAGALGSSVLARNEITADVGFNSNISGSNIRPSNASGSAVSGTLTGSWQVNGFMYGTGNANTAARVSLCKRVS